MLLAVKRMLVKHAPDLLRPPLSLLPFALQQRLLTLALTKVCADALADGDFDFLEGKYLKVTVTDLALGCIITLVDGRLQVLASAPQQDVSFSGGLNDLILIAGRKEDPDSLFFQRRLKIEGDTELGLEVKNLLDSLDLSQLPALLRRGLGDLAGFIQSAAEVAPDGQTALVPR
ncbi:SCP2 sterol-binding domain-containing protein [Pseudaeromonas sp. ZJS20]